MAAIQFTAKVKESRLLELPEETGALGLKPGEEIQVSLDRGSAGHTVDANQGGLAAQWENIEPTRDTVRRDLTRLEKAFPDLSARLVAGISLKDSLRTLEKEAARYDYEMLSRVAAVLHDTLKNNPIESFEEAELQGFLAASKQATEGRPESANPYECELALYRSGLSWLPSISRVNVRHEKRMNRRPDTRWPRKPSDRSS